MYRSLAELREDEGLEWASVRERDTGEALDYVPVIPLCTSPYRELGVVRGSGWVDVVWSEGAIKHGITFETGDRVQSFLTLLDRPLSEVLEAFESFCERVGLDYSSFGELQELIAMTVGSGLRRRQRYVGPAVDWIETLNAVGDYQTELEQLVDETESVALPVRLRIAHLVGRDAATVPPDIEYDEWRN